MSSTPQPAPALASSLDLEIDTAGGLGAERAEWVARDADGVALRRFREFTAANAGPVIDPGCQMRIVWKDRFGLRLTSFTLTFDRGEPNGLFTPLFDQAHTSPEPQSVNLVESAVIEIGPIANLGTFRWRLQMLVRPVTEGEGPSVPSQPQVPGQPPILPSAVPAGMVDVGN